MASTRRSGRRSISSDNLCGLQHSTQGCPCTSINASSPRRQQMESSNRRVRVFARVRPLVPSEGNVQNIEVVELEEATNVVRVHNRIGEELAPEIRAFTFDGVFPTSTTQERIFQEVGQPVLQECLSGINGTVFAYGQIGSGKTYSLLRRGVRAGTDDSNAGLLSRLVISLFKQIMQDDEARYEVEIAALQVYNEQADDLLHPDHRVGGGHNLAVQDGGLAPGLTWLRCGQAEQALQTFGQASGNLLYAETNMNRTSSRSHAVFQMRVTRHLLQPNGNAATRARLCVVDLAGSERVKKSGVKGKHFKEAMSINGSLLALGNVVNALAAKKSHVPFRNSKLTRILDGSIGGNCRTALLVCVSPDVAQTLETISSLEFAARAMCVEVDPKVNAIERCTFARQGLSHRAEHDAEQSLERMQEKVARLERSLDATQGEALNLRQALAHAELRAEQFQALADTRAEEVRNESFRARRAEERACVAVINLEAARHDGAQQKHALERRLSVLQAEIDSMRSEWASRTAIQQRDCHTRAKRKHRHRSMHLQQQQQ